MLKIIELTKIYKNPSLRVLNGINMSVDLGDYIAIMGDSGSGKSTLLNILGCLDNPTSGKYEIQREDVTSLSQRKLAHIRNKEIGFVFQNFHLLPRYTVFENIELPLLYTNTSNRLRRQKVYQALEQVGMVSKANEIPLKLSGGQQQKIAIARAIVGSPSLLLADEPTGNLDSKSTEDILRIFNTLHKEGTTIIIVTHDIFVANHAQQIIAINQGKISSTYRSGHTELSHPYQN